MIKEIAYIYTIAKQSQKGKISNEKALKMITNKISMIIRSLEHIG